MGTIGNYTDTFHVTTERFDHRPGEVRLELWRRQETSWSSSVQQWLKCPEGDAEGDREVERVAKAMIKAAQGS